VRDGLTKAPIAGATVEATAPQFKRTATSDGKGEFTFDHLAPGNYSLKYTMQGYIPANFTGSAQAIVRKAGKADPVVLELLQAGRLEGVVLDEEGHPMPGVMLYSGIGHLATTGADGRYLIENLRPGNYTLLLRTPIEIRRKSLKRDPETGEIFGYPNTAYFPGVADPQAATTLAVSGGFDLRGLEIRLRRARLVDFSGRTVDRVGGEPLAEARVELLVTNSTAPLMDETYKEREVSADGGFRFPLVQPGSYLLLIYRNKRSNALPYILPVEIGKTGIEDMKIAVPPFASVQGSILAPPDTEWAGEFIFSVRSPVSAALSRDFTVNLEKFSIDDLPPGRWIVEAESNVKRLRDSASLFIQSTAFGTQDASSAPIAITESGNPPLELRLTAESGRILGSVVDQNGIPRPATPVLVMRSSSQPFRPFRTGANTKEDGTFFMDGLSPGRYRVVAIVDGVASSTDAVTVDVKLGETATVRITVLKY
jgi:hypothetical protein